MVISENAREAPVVATCVVDDSVATVVASLWAKVLGVTTPDVHTSFFDAGGTSIQAITLGFGLNDAFDLDLPQGIVFRAPTIWELSDFIRSAAARAAQRVYVLNAVAGTDRVPVLLIPGASGDLAGMQAFGSGVLQRDVFGIDLRGLQPDQGGPLHTVSEITADLADELDASKTPRRIHLIGYCLGGVLAHALASELSARGWDVVGVFMLNSTLVLPDFDLASATSDRLRVLAQFNELEVVPETASEMFEMLVDAEDLIDRSADAFSARIETYAATCVAVAAHQPQPASAISTHLYATEDRIDQDMYERARPGISDLDSCLPGLILRRLTLQHDEVPTDLQFLSRLDADLSRVERAGGQPGRLLGS